jgi:hypothetical protein
MGTLCPSGSNVVLGATVKLTEPVCAKPTPAARRKYTTAMIDLLAIAFAFEFMSLFLVTVIAIRRL